MKETVGNPLHLKSLNHISLVCRSVEESIDFYTNVLGFFPIRRPGSFDFDGAWLFNYAIGIHLLQSENPDNMQKKSEINPKDNHISFQIIVVEDLKEYIAEAPEEENIAQDRRPFDLLVILNPKLRKKSDKSAFFFEGCLSVGGYRALVERYLEVEVNGLGRDGKPIKVEACGWQARILQHECDHLEGTMYVDKMVKRTFRTVENVDLPLANGCPKQGVR